MTFLRLAALFQGGLLLLAMILGSVAGCPPIPQCEWTLTSIGLGVLATFPMLLLLAVSFRSDQKSLVEIRRFLLEALGRPLAECHLVELAVVALLAGFSEEFLFRGVLEPCLGFGSPLVGIILSNILFGTCHAVTPVYWLIATVLGCYLSLTLRLTPNLNLLVPVVCHSFYDFVAFIVVRNHYLKLQAQDQPKDDDLPVGSDDPSSPDFPISQ